MAIKYHLISIFFILALLAGSCNPNRPDSKMLVEIDTLKDEDEATKKARSIFYRMYLPSEMHKVFEKAGAIYDPAILNPVENVNLYDGSAKAAVNLGIYGVDLSYNKMFGQNQKTLLYFAVIHKLSQQLGIPDNQFSRAIKKMEKNMSNRDSLAIFATEVYSSTNRFLNENDREATAALIIAGGWVEALFIASGISEQNVSNQEILERIAFQKYSLRSLISLLSNFQSDQTVNKYLLMFKALNRAFDKFEIFYEANDLSIDTINKLINANRIEMSIRDEDIRNIKAIIRQIRADMVR